MFVREPYGSSFRACLTYPYEHSLDLSDAYCGVGYAVQLLYKASQYPMPVCPGLAAFSTRLGMRFYRVPVDAIVRKVVLPVRAFLASCVVVAAHESVDCAGNTFYVPVLPQTT